MSLVVADRINASVEAIAALGPSAPAALAALHEFLDGGSVTQLSSVLGLTHSGTVRLVDRLGAEGLVERVGAQDGRAVSVVLTGSGRRMALPGYVKRETSLTSALSALTSGEVDNLAAALDAMLTTVTLARAEERSVRSHERSYATPWLLSSLRLRSVRPKRRQLPGQQRGDLQQPELARLGDSPGAGIGKRAVRNDAWH